MYLNLKQLGRALRPVVAGRAIIKFAISFLVLFFMAAVIQAADGAQPNSNSTRTTLNRPTVSAVARPGGSNSIRTPNTGKAAAHTPRRRLRVAIYARYSTDEQDASSIDDQVALCEKCLEAMGILDAEITVFSDMEMSGELRNRPGIDKIWRGVEVATWDLLICEDSGRLFRNESACIELIEIAVDAGMRVVCINDDVDSDVPGWQDRLRDAARHHAKANFYTRQRIFRRHKALWEMGAGLSAVKPGYRRKPTVAATAKHPEQGPHFDEIDPVFGPIVTECYDRIGNGELPWKTAKWATKQGLPKYGNSKSPVWTERQIIDLIRRTIYRGFDQHREKIVKKKLRTGKKTMVHNDEDRWTREMPHLRLVSDAAWCRANKAIDDRQKRKSTARGAEHPLFGKSRDSQGPLSRVFRCACGAKMHQEGRIEGGYRCGASKKGKCWRKQTALREIAHRTIGKAISDAILAHQGALVATMECVKELYNSDSERQARESQLTSDLRKYSQQRERLMRLAMNDDQPPASIVSELKELEHRLLETDGLLTELASEAASEKRELSESQIRDAIALAAEQVMNDGPEMASILEELIPNKIRAIPYQQFGSKLVVMRAEFDLEMVKILPLNLQTMLGKSPEQSIEWTTPIPFLLNLFEPSLPCTHAVKAYEIYQTGDVSLEELGRQLGISKRQAFLAKELGKQMHAGHIADPYVRLNEPPAAASRWRTHPKLQDDPDSGEGAA
jgi:site-specific DNA recombinase